MVGLRFLILKKFISKQTFNQKEFCKKMIFYNQFNIINEIETLIFTFFFSFFTIRIFLKCNLITKYPRISQV